MRSFALFDEANSNLYRTIKQSIIEGLSIIFQRFHENHKTFLRGNPEKSCQKILGFDANMLYLYCIDQPMPTGSFVRRRLEDGFHPKKRDRYTLVFDWMNFLNHSHGCQIQHKLNTGKEKKFGPYPVDGFDQTTNTIYQFHGCYYHAHSCWLIKSIKDKKNGSTRRTPNIKKKRKDHQIPSVFRSYCHRNVGISLSTSPTTRSSSSDLRRKQTIYDFATKNE